MITFPPKRDFFSLSLSDLVEAREAYHVHLDSLEHVVATAIGRCRIRKADDDYKEPGKIKAYGAGGERTFANSKVTHWSWPGILVLVDRWFTRKELGEHPDQAVPRLLFMPDGRIVPTCVIYVEAAPKEETGLEHLSFASKTLGGGYICFTESQQVQRVGTLGCLAKKEGELYALTCGHVAGSPGNEVFTYIRSNKESIGTSHPVRLAKRKFGEVYPKWPGDRTMVNIDAALIRLSDASTWTSQVFGIGEMGRMIDFSPESLNLDILGTPVRAFSSVSGPMEGEIQGLFPRYCTKGGVDSVADLLIGPRHARPEEARPGVNLPQLKSRPGDSGTIWFYDPPSGADRQPRGARARSLRPLAMQWGGERFSSGSGRPIQLVLATFLSTVCQLLDIDLVTDSNLGFSEYWGKIAHFKIGYKACEIVRAPKLKKLLMANRLRIGFDDAALELGKNFRVGRDKFVPLADVPDYVWIGMRNKKERKNEGKQHFADMDDPGRKKFARKTLLDLCKDDPKNLDPQVWKDFYAALSDEDFEYDGGYLPFRIRQIYRAMVQYLKQGNVKNFLAAAGVLAHYVGDAAMPFHISKLHHGYGPERVDRDSPEYKAYKKSREYKIHAILEEQMFEVRAVEMLSAVDDAIDGFAGNRKKNLGGEFGAVKHAFDLMREVLTLVPPAKVIKADDTGMNAPDRARAFYDSFGPATAACVAKSCVVLADLWESAWAEGLAGRNALNVDGMGTYTENELQQVYRRPDFLPAYNLDDYIRLGFRAPVRSGPGG